MPEMAIVIVFVVLVLITITLGVRIVPQGSKYVVQRLGKYHKALLPGLNIIVPSHARRVLSHALKSLSLSICCSCDRVSTPNFCNAFFAWNLTVALVTPILAAAWLVVYPKQTSAVTSRSRGVSVSHLFHNSSCE